MTDYMEYIKGGDVLIAPSLEYKPSYMLRCCLCGEYYSDLNQFYYHYQSHGDVKYSEVISYLPSTSVGMYGTENTFCNVNISADLGAVKIKSEQHDDGEEIRVTINDKEGFIKEEINYQYPDACMESCQVDSSNEDYIYGREANVMSDEDLDSDVDTAESKNRKYSICIRDFIKTKENPIALIEAYKNQPLMWNTNYTKYSRDKERSKCLREIVTSLEKRLHLKLTCNDVSGILYFLRLKYKEKLRCDELGENKSDADKSLDFLNHLDFLKPFMENNSIAVLSPDMPHLSSEQITQILSIYERFPHLWNSNLIENVCENKRIEAIEQMLAVVNSEMHLDVKQSILEIYLCNIHACLSREKRRDMGVMQMPVEAKSEYREHMMFLYDHVGPFRCSECQRIFRKPLHFKEHQIDHDASLRFKCSLCEKEFKYAELYREHVKRHLNDRCRECEECGKKFFRTDELMSHIRCHTGDKPFSCEVCGESFRHKKTFTSHKRRHNKDYLHYCPTCSKGFYTKDDMKVHIASHNDERDFVCQTCGKAFKTRRTMKTHEWTHEDGCYPCEHCGKTFKHKNRLYLHVKRLHKNSQVETQ